MPKKFVSKLNSEQFLSRAKKIGYGIAFNQMNLSYALDFRFDFKIYKQDWNISLNPNQQYWSIN